MAIPRYNFALKDEVHFEKLARYPPCTNVFGKRKKVAKLNLRVLLFQ